MTSTPCSKPGLEADEPFAGTVSTVEAVDRYLESRTDLSHAVIDQPWDSGITGGDHGRANRALDLVISASRHGADGTITGAQWRAARAAA